MYFIQYFHVCCTLVVVYKVFIVHAYIPEYIHVCHRSDPEINHCILKSVEILRPKLREGIPELMIPTMEPLSLGSISLQRGPRGAHVNLNLTQILSWGASTFTTQSMNLNLPKNVFEFKILISHIIFKGKYSINMNVILLHVNGRGNIIGNFSNFVIEAKMQGHKMYNASTDSHHLHFSKIRLKLKIGSSTMMLQGLFGGNPVLSRVANDILEQNSALFIEEIRPALETSLADIFTKIANGITLSFTYDELFPL